jgi:hypothetical protein
MNDSYRRLRAALTGSAALLLLTAWTARAQAPAAPPPVPAAGGNAPPAQSAPPGSTLDALDWLQGCWKGSVNERDFREQWLPSGGGMMIGAGHTVMQGKTQDYEYLRLETRPDGLYYVTLPSGQKEASFKLSGTLHDEHSDADIWTFTNTADAFPQRILYRRGHEGWLYAGVEGTLNGEDREVIYPMRHVNCETGDPIRN